MTENAPDTAEIVNAIAKAARAAAPALARASAPRKADALMAAATSIRRHATAIVTANAIDMEAGRAAGLSGAMLDRLALDHARVEAMARGVEAVPSWREPCSTRPRV